jgi:hypothetical protein
MVENIIYFPDIFFPHLINGTFFAIGYFPKISWAGAARLDRARLIYFSKEFILHFSKELVEKYFLQSWRNNIKCLRVLLLYIIFLVKKMVGSQVENRGDIHKRHEID